MLTQQRDALAEETDNRKALASALAKETDNRKALASALAKEKADRKVEMALRIAESNRLEDLLENQKVENNQLLEDLQSKQDRLTKEMSEHAIDMKSISEVRNLCNYIEILSHDEPLAHSEVDPSPSSRPSRPRSRESPGHHGT
jgi:hypothetical protein